MGLPRAITRRFLGTAQAAYNPSECAVDVEDLRRALGAPRLNQVPRDRRRMRRGAGVLGAVRLARSPAPALGTARVVRFPQAAHAVLCGARRSRWPPRSPPRRRRRRCCC
jgi:hypothetical protein